MKVNIAPCVAWGVMALACTIVRAADEPFVQKLEGTNVTFKMVPIPAGKFLMGSPETEAGRHVDEGPRHEVTIEAFYMEEHEVTWGEYQLFMNYYNLLSARNAPSLPKDKLADAVTFPTPMYDVREGPVLQRMGGRGPNMPAVIMSQFAAKQYTKWLSGKTGRFYRLPSEAEWEYAGRAGTNTPYFFGDDATLLGVYAWFRHNSAEEDGDTGYHAVMTKKPNRWGLYDMYGNVMEWCVDLYDAEAYSKFAGKAVEGRDAVVWAGLTRTPYPRVIRGGGYDSDAQACRSAARMGSNPRMNQDPSLPKSPHWMADAPYVGFRVVSPVREPGEEEKRKWWDADDSITLTTIQRDQERKAVITPGPVNR